MGRPNNTPEWFVLSEQANSQIMERIASAVSACQLPLQVQRAPMLAHWFMLDSLLLANRANREGMHANALSLTRQCLESLTVIELGISGHPEAAPVLLKWDQDELSAGKLRAWLERHLWSSYGTGLWTEPWATFMREFSAALQPYAHYGSKLAQWQVHLVSGKPFENVSANLPTAIIELCPRAYDAQKATRITLFHAVLVYALGRIWMAHNTGDDDFRSLVVRLGNALGRSRCLDGHATDWSQQFWTMVWGRDGDTRLE